MQCVCVCHFDFETYFAPQQPALFQHLNLQRWSEHVVLSTFSLRILLRATAVCTFGTAQLPKAVRTCGAVTILTWKRASRHNGVHFSTSEPPKVVRTRGAFSIFTSNWASRHSGVHVLNSSTAKSALNPRCFLTCSLRHVLRATSAGTFGASQLPKVLRS